MTSPAVNLSLPFFSSAIPSTLGQKTRSLLPEHSSPRYPLLSQSCEALPEYPSI